MYCPLCGSENQDNAYYCHVCGEKLMPRQQPQAPVAKKERKPRRSRKKLWILLSVLILVLAIGGTTTFLLLRNGPRKIVNNTLKAYYAADVSTLFDLVHEDVLDEMFGSKSGIKAAKKTLENRIESTFERYDENWEAWSIEYRIVDVEKLEGDALEELQDLYDDEFDCEVTAAKEVMVKLTFIQDDTRRIYDELICVVKIDGKWYLDVYSVDGYF